MQRTESPASLTALQINVAGLAVGVIGFTCFAMFSPRPGYSQGQAQGGTDLATMLLIAMAAAAVLGFAAWSFVLGPLTLRRAARAWASRTSDPAALTSIYQTFTIRTFAAAALAEVVGLLGAINVYVTGNTWALGGPIVATAAMLLAFPSRARLESFVERATGHRIIGAPS